MEEPNIIFVGDPDSDDADSFRMLENIIIIQCKDAEQVKTVLNDGMTDFTIFGG